MKQAALFIGINDYQPPLKSLSCAREDAAALYQLFLKRYTSGLVHFLSDTNSDEIVNKLKYLMGELDSGDLLLVYFSGHGVEERNNHYLLSSQAERFGDEWRHALSVNVLKQITKKRGVQTVFILDSCREHTYEGSRDAGGAAATRGTTMKKLVETQEADYLSPVIFCSCSGGEMAFEVKTIQHGLFTLALIELLSNAKSATLEDITRNVSTEISKLIKKYRLKGRQTPEVIKNPLINPVIWGGTQEEDAPSAEAPAPRPEPAKTISAPIPAKPSPVKTGYNAKDYKVRLQTVRDILAMQMYSPSEQQEKIKLLQEIHQLHDNGDHEQACTLLETVYETCLEEREIYNVSQLQKQIEEQLPELKEYLSPLFELDYTIACGDFEHRKYRQAQTRMEILLNRDFPPARAKKAAADKQIMLKKKKEEAEKKAEKRREAIRYAWKDFCWKIRCFFILFAMFMGLCIILTIILAFIYPKHFNEYKNEFIEYVKGKSQVKSEIQQMPAKQSQSTYYIKGSSGRSFHA